MTLTLADMPTGFSQKPAPATGPKSAAAVAKGTSTSAGTYRAHGYLTGYEADYTRNIALTDMAAGATEVVSTVSIYKSAGGAKWSLSETRSHARSTGSGYQLAPRWGTSRCSVRSSKSRAT
jgi:hypothetical protein